jgi:hypothetical protein
LLFYAANPRDWGSCWWAHAEEALHHCSLSRMRPIWRLVIVATGEMTTDFASAEDRRVHIHIRRASKNGAHEFVKVPRGEPLSGLR